MMSSTDSDFPPPLREPRVRPLIMGSPTKISENRLLALENTFDVPDEFYFKILGIYNHVDNHVACYCAFLSLISRLCLHGSRSKS